MTTAAKDVVNAATGEALSTAIVPFDMATYLADVNGNQAIAQQKKLMAAYDAACAGLIGENDVQKEGNRTFKKKSAWRKLARHFNISTAVIGVERGAVGDFFIATVTVRATAPWGQCAEAVGACCQDEEKGRRTISIADAIATAETRATNRAVSNLIAMGEVSAEEIGERGERPAPRQTAVTFGPDSVLDFGKYKGTKVRDLDAGFLTWAIEPGRKLGPYTDAWQRAFDDELTRRENADGDDGQPDNDDSDKAPF